MKRSWLVLMGCAAMVSCTARVPCPTLTAPPVETREGLSKDAFLPLMQDEALRETLWEVFQLAENEARTFVEGPEGWKPIRLVRAASGAVWYDNGLIEITTDVADRGVIFHEVFHNAHYTSALHEGADEQWGEAFSDAFRFLMERSTLTGQTSQWSIDMEGAIGQPYDIVSGRLGGGDYVGRYVYPATLILDKCDRDLEKFRAMWWDLNRKRTETGADVLNDFFGYEL